MPTHDIALQGKKYHRSMQPMGGYGKYVTDQEIANV